MTLVSPHRLEFESTAYSTKPVRRSDIQEEREEFMFICESERIPKWTGTGIWPRLGDVICCIGQASVEGGVIVVRSGVHDYVRVQIVND